MRAAQMKERPSFTLMKQNDIQNLYYMRMPRWLFSDPRYAELSLDAKVAYTFLLNRFQLSRRKGWVNEQGEVFVIFPRLALAKELRICEKRVTAAFRKLVELELVWEKRCGRGDANQIYLAKVEPVDDPTYECAPFSSEAHEDGGTRTADSAVLSVGTEGAWMEPGDNPDADSVAQSTQERFAPAQEPQNWRFQNSGNGASRTAGLAVAEPSNPPSSKKEIRKNNLSRKEVSQSVFSAREDGLTDEQREGELSEILDACELDCFSPEIARVFENAIERLYYSDSFRVGNATLPQPRVRSKLRLLDGMILRNAERKLRSSRTENVRNSTAYTMSTLFNCITEIESDLVIDPYLNSLSAGLGEVMRC